MSTEPSILYSAIVSRRLEDVDAALARRRPSPSSLSQAAGLILADSFSPDFRVAVLERLLALGLDPNDSPLVLGKEGKFPLGYRTTLLEYANRYHSGSVDNWGLPLLARACLGAPELIPLLLGAGADPTLSGPYAAKPSRWTTWSAVLAILDTDEGKSRLNLLAPLAPVSTWTPEFLGEVWDQMCNPPVGRGPGPTTSDIRAFWEAIEPWRRGVSIPHDVLLLGQGFRNATWARMIQVLDDAVLATLDVLLRKEKSSLGQLALELALTGEPEFLDRVIEGQRSGIFESASPWSRVAWVYDRGVHENWRRSRKETLSLGAVGTLVCCCFWPETTPVIEARATALLERLEKLQPGRADSDLEASGQSLSQLWARRLRAGAGVGAPLGWLALQKAWWAINPLTGQNAAHGCAHPSRLLQGSPIVQQRVREVLDFSVVDHRGNQAGASLAARLSNSAVWSREWSEDGEALRVAFSDGRLPLTGRAFGREVASWVALDDEVRKSFDAAARERRLRGFTVDRRRWRFHDLAFEKNARSLDRQLTRLNAADRVQALSVVDAQGCTPMSMLCRTNQTTLAPSETKEVTAKTKKFEDTFFVLNFHGPVYVPEMDCHPFVELMFSIHQPQLLDPLMVSSHAGWKMARDLADRLKDPRVPDSFLETTIRQLSQAFVKSGKKIRWDGLWSLLELPPAMRGKMVSCALEEVIASAPSGVDKSHRIADLLESWEKAGVPVDAADLEGEVLSRLCCFVENQPAFFRSSPMRIPLIRAVVTAQDLDLQLIQEEPVALSSRFRL